MHVAALDGDIAAVVCEEGLGSFESLAVSERYAWSPQAFLPNVLMHYDLPELVAGLRVPTLVTAPQDARQRPLEKAAAEALYSQAREVRPDFALAMAADSATVRRFVWEALGL